MIIHHGGTAVAKGLYWSPMDGGRVDLQDRGILPGEKTCSYLRMSPLVLLLIAHAVRKHNVPVVYNVIFKYEWTRILLFNLYALRIVKKIIVNSPMIRGDLHRRTAGLRDRTETIPLGVNGAIYHPQRDGEENILRKAHNTPANTKLVGMVARYDRIKGHETFLRAATRVCEVRQDVKFFIIGGSVLVNQIPGAGEYRGKILNLRRELHLENTVTFIDEHPDVPALMRSLDLLVCPSDSEGFGLVVLEALASGVLVIASRFIGAVEYLDGEPGIFIAEPHSTESFVCVMLHVLEHLDHGNSRYTVSERLIRRFTWQTHASACERVYEECSL